MPILPTQEESDWISPGAALRILGVASTKTLASLATKGRIKARKLPSGHRRYDRASVVALAESGEQSSPAAAADGFGVRLLDTTGVSGDGE